MASLTETTEVTSPKAPKREDGTYLYVRTVSSWGRKFHSLVAAKSLREAKEQHGWSRNRYESIRVHRATVDELTAFAPHHFPELTPDSPS